MYESMMDMRKGGMVVFINEDDNGEDFILIRNLNDLQHYTISGGWNSIEDFEAVVGYDKEELIGKAICYAGSKLWFADDEDWFNGMDKARIEAVFNGYVLDSDKLSVEEAGKVIIDYFYHICGKNVGRSIKEIVDRRISYLHRTTTGYFIERVRRQIIGDFHIWMA